MFNFLTDSHKSLFLALDFKILQWNCRELIGKMAEISALIQKFDVICLQETWLNQSNKISFKNYNVYRCDRNDPRIGGGFMIICKSNLNPSFHKIDLSEFPKCDVTMISLLDNCLYHERIFIVSFYKPPNIKFEVNHWRELFGTIELIATPSQIFILGDFNAQNIAWGSTMSNSSGNILCKFLSETSFYFLNKGVGTQISAIKNHISAFDLSITNSKYLIVSWSIEEDTRRSDHLPINLIISRKHKAHFDKKYFLEPHISRPGIFLGNFDKKLFTEIVQKRLNESPIDLEGPDLIHDMSQLWNLLYKPELCV